MSLTQEQKGEKREQLLEMKGQLSKRIEAIYRDKTRKQGPINADFQEQSVDLQNNEVLDHIDKIDRDELEQIESALLRIEKDTYGQCTQCSNTISDARLDALPIATLCIECSAGE